MTSITIDLPLPSPALHQNARVHHMARARATKDARGTARLCALSALGRAAAPKWTACKVRCDFRFATKRRRDRQNLIGAMKASVDGIVDAGIMHDDSGIVDFRTTIEAPSKDPGVTITIERAG